MLSQCLDGMRAVMIGIGDKQGSAVVQYAAHSGLTDLLLSLLEEGMPEDLVCRWRIPHSDRSRSDLDL